MSRGARLGSKGEDSDGEPSSPMPDRIAPTTFSGAAGVTAELPEIGLISIMVAEGTTDGAGKVGMSALTKSLRMSVGSGS